MPRYALLLRGVNVGRSGRLPMPDLRRLLEDLGHTDVATYLQSGNAVVTSPLRSRTKIAEQVQRALVDQRGLSTAVLVRTADQLAQMIDNNPYPHAARDTPKLLHAAFLGAEPAPSAVHALAAQSYEPDECSLRPGVLYLSFAKNVHESRMATDAGKRLAVPATARNWNTVLALRQLLGPCATERQP